MKKILVTGATGFLGSRIVPFFSDRYVVYAPTHSEMDISNKTEVNRIFRDYIPDYVIHCAAMSDVGRCEKEPELSWKINVEGSINIALAAANLSHSNDSKDTKCIICSSDQVYFGSKLDGSHEENEVL